MNRLLIPAFSASCLCLVAACVGVTGPTPVGDGTYSTGTAGPGAAPLGYEDERYQQAIRFCFEQGKQLVPLEGQDLDVTGAPRDGSALQFRCAGPGEPGWTEPVG